MQINKTHHSCACQEPFGSMALSSGSNPGGKISQLTVGKKKNHICIVMHHKNSQHVHSSKEKPFSRLVYMLRFLKHLGRKPRKWPGITSSTFLVNWGNPFFFFLEKLHFQLHN